MLILHREVLIQQQTRKLGVLSLPVERMNAERFQLVPDVGDIQITSCSFQPQLLVIHYPYPTQVTDITVFMSKNSWFDVHLVSCQDEAKCHSLPSAPITKTTKKEPPIAAPY